jgi:uncharacterized membrane protein
MTSWKRDFASGLIVLVPILVTLYVLYWLFGLISGVALIATQVEDPVLAVLLALLVFILMVFSVGYMMRTAIGSIVEGVIDNIINKLPGLRIIYNASKMAVETVFSGGTGEFQKPVKVEPWEGMRMTAFKTGKEAPDGREVIFLPTSPNITTGFVLEVDTDNLEDTDETVEDALTRVLSAGFGENDGSAVPEEIIEGETVEGEPESESREDSETGADSASREDSESRTDSASDST